MNTGTMNGQRLPDYLQDSLRIVFIGYNPGLTSAAEGHHFAGRNNQFYRLLQDSGLTPRLYAPTEDRTLLEIGYGITNIVARPSAGASELSGAELAEGAVALRRKIALYRPKVACFLGKDIYRAYAGLKPSAHIEYGVQHSSLLPPVVDFVAPNPSSRSTVPYEERLQWFRALRGVVEGQSGPAEGPGL